MIAGPLYGEEGIVIADCDLRIGLHAKRLFDAAGHYGREDTLLPLLAVAGPEAGGRGRKSRSSNGSLLNAQNPRRSRGFGVGDPGFEPGTSALSERRSNQLS